MYITNIQYPYKDSWDIKKYYCTFDLEGVDNTYANALRRIMLTDIKSIGFKTRPYNESDINIIKNETNMDNQILSHRIGFVPIHIEHPDQFDTGDYQFYINKNNTGNDIIEVTSQDFQIKQLSQNKNLSRKEVETYFPINPLTNEHIFICYLFPDKTGSGEAGGKLHFTAKATLKTARSDAKYNVAQTSFINKKDPIKVRKAWKEYYDNEKQNTTESKNVLEKRFQITESNRHFYTNEFGHPDKFEFFIESYTIPPTVVLNKAVDILHQKLSNFSNNLKSGNYNEVDIYASETDMNAFDVLIHNETYTLSALLQSYILKYFVEMKDIVTFVAYKKPHPLKNNILLRIALKEEQNNKENVVKVIDKCVQQLLKINQSLKTEVIKLPNVAKYLTESTKILSGPKVSRKTSNITLDDLETDSDSE
jgi:DNA-directed RNA polymerase subunit L